MKTISKNTAKYFAAVLAVMMLMTSVFAIPCIAEGETDAEVSENELTEVVTETETEATPESEEPKEGEIAEAEEETEAEAEVEEVAEETEEKEEAVADDGEYVSKVLDEETIKDAEKVVHSNTGFLAGGFLAEWFGTALGFIAKAFPFKGGYIVAILVFALAIKLILFPLSIKQQKNSQKMARLAPKQEAIRKKYAGRDDRATQMKMNEEIQQLYQEEKYNPMSGCLPMLLQLPIIFALYSSITSPLSSMLGYTAESLKTLGVKMVEADWIVNAIEKGSDAAKSALGFMTQSSAISKISTEVAQNTELGQKYIELIGAEKVDSIVDFYNQFSFFGVNLMDNPNSNWFSLLIIVPILVFLSSFFSTKIIRKFTYNPGGAQNDLSMKFMDWSMPLMILFFSVSVPALVGIYWIFQNVISIGQQFALYKLFPVKEPTPEEIREAELLMKGKKPKKADVVIDDDDEPKTKKSSPVGKAPIKKKKSKSPFIYAKKGIAPKYIERIKASGKTPKAKKKP